MITVNSSYYKLMMSVACLASLFNLLLTQYVRNQPQEKETKKAVAKSAPWLANKKAMNRQLPVYPWLNYPIYIILRHRARWVDQWKVIKIPKAAKCLSSDCVQTHCFTSPYRKKVA
jgi:hypothetical protein